MNVRLVSITRDAEKLISYIARVSNPENQDNPNYAGLIKYLIKNRHWSPLEMAHMVIEIKTSRAIAAQILRHRSFSFQEFSQRYSEATEFEPIELRKQAVKNRQSSDEIFNPIVSSVSGATAREFIDDIIAQVHFVYRSLINAGIAKEVARMILPLTTQTTLYMAGNIRSWIHYIELRDDEHAQKEHQLIAKEIKNIFMQQFPVISEALGWINENQSSEISI